MTEDATWAEDMPAHYDAGLGPALFAPYAQELAARAAALRPGRVLELAAGTGQVTRALVAALPGAQVLATDLNAPMVAWSAERVPGASWRQADAQALDLPDASVDLVVCSFGVMFFPDRVAAHAEALRVLRPGGTLLLTVWDEVGGTAFAAALMEALRALLPADPPDFVVRVPHGYADPAQIRSDAQAAGLEVDAVDQVVLQGRAASAAALADGFCRGTPLRFALQQRGDLDELTAGVAREMTARLGPGPLEGALSAFVVTAQRPGTASP